MTIRHTDWRSIRASLPRPMSGVDAAVNAIETDQERAERLREREARIRDAKRDVSC